ncbi:MAG: hypothetical protein KDA77_01115, partial [Planctomycetaceae bacterium]|nr:hypothetical protein [Planctomycetaceae bacterium]
MKIKAILSLVGLCLLTGCPSSSAPPAPASKENAASTGAGEQAKDAKQKPAAEPDSPEAVQVFKDLDAKMVLSDDGRVLILDLKGTKAKDEDLKHLAGLPSLERLTIWGPNFTDTATAEIGKKKKLWYLNLESTAIGDQGVKNLADLQDLQVLSLRATNITNDALKVVAAFSKLKDLDLRFNKEINDEGMPLIKGMKNLRVLKVQATQVTDAGMKDIAELPNL